MGILSRLFGASPAASEQPQRAASPKMQTRRYRAPRDLNSVDGFVPMNGHERVSSHLSLIRARARDLAHNNPFAARAVSILTAHTVGSGIRFSFRGAPAYDAHFYEWSRSTACDYEGALDFYGLQTVAIRTMFEAGDSFIIMRDVRTDKGVQVTLQLVDPDLVDESASPHFAGNEVVSGVEVTREGIVVGYHFRSSTSPLDMTTRFVPAKDVIHLFERLYPGQLRGIPRGSQALLSVKNLNAFIGAALVKAKIEACLALFITRDTEEHEGGLITGSDEAAVEDDGEKEYFDGEAIDPGMVVRLRPGESAQAVIPSGSHGFIDYVSVTIQQASTSYRCTYSQLSGDLSKATFANEKAGRMEFNRDIDVTRQHFVIPPFRRIEDRVRSAYQLTTGEQVNAEITVVTPARESIEPAKEVLADMTLLAAGGMSWRQFVLARGLDPDVQAAEIKAEREMLESMGISLKFGAAEIGALTTALANVVAADEAEQARLESAPN